MVLLISFIMIFVAFAASVVSIACLIAYCVALRKNKSESKRRALLICALVFLAIALAVITVLVYFVMRLLFG